MEQENGLVYKIGGSGESAHGFGQPSSISRVETATRERWQAVSPAERARESDVSPRSLSEERAASYSTARPVVVLRVHSVVAFNALSCIVDTRSLSKATQHYSTRGHLVLLKASRILLTCLRTHRN